MSALLEFDDVHYAFPGSAIPALRGASLSIATGQRIALIGRNGAGKSTLLLHANGILRPAAGQVRLEGAPLEYTRRGLLRVRRQVGLVFQNPDDQLFSASVLQDISFGPMNLGLSITEVRRRVAEAADLCSISNLLDRPTHALSSGQKSLVALAGVLAMAPRILLVDETTSGLDPWMRYQIFAIFDRLVEQGVTVLLTTHDLTVARQWADTVVVMHEGRVVASAPPVQVFADPDLQALLGPAP
ncbi:MAG: ABC transporter ATP-binding protein [Roseiflexus sp.]|nr:ABC transporter ATP-binding protein [Roseiflexus sp.]